eukprot:s3594_g14.t1
MKERYEKVRTGRASDALESPDTTPLKNQDAEMADEQKQEVADADRKVERPNVIDLVSSELVPLPEVVATMTQVGHWVEDTKSMKAMAVDQALFGPLAWRLACKMFGGYAGTPWISSSCYTKIIEFGGETIMDDEDDWRNVLIRNKKLRFKWIGQTVFKIKPAREPAPSGDGSFPSMPVVPDNDSEHREKLAKPVGQKELMQNPKAQASLDVEWEKLMKKRAWDMDMESVCEWERVSGDSQKSGRKVHVGEIFEICVEKGSELPEGDPLRKFKGHTVFQGHNVKGESNDNYCTLQ